MTKKTAKKRAPSFLDNISTSDGRGTKRKRDREINDLWELWCTETRRRDHGAVVTAAKQSFETWLSAGYGFNELSYIVRSAARLRPVKTDRDDVKRLVNALGDIRIENQARQAYERDRQVYPYTPYTPEVNILRDELADLLDDDENAWGEQENEDANWLMEKMTTESVQQQRDDMERAGVWHSPMSPSDFREMKRKRKWREGLDGKAAKVSGGGKQATSSYASGAREAASVADIDFSVDPAANRLFSTGASARRVLDLHNQAPEGYWEDVAELMDVDDISARRAHSLLSSQYDGWHPRDRRK